jgi:hypothetical protein
LGLAVITRRLLEREHLAAIGGGLVHAPRERVETSFSEEAAGLSGGRRDLDFEPHLSGREVSLASHQHGVLHAVIVAEPQAILNALDWGTPLFAAVVRAL